MPSASHQSPVELHHATANILLTALNSALRAVDGRVILLRPMPQVFDSQQDDIDLLLSESQRQQLLCAAFVQCESGHIHCRIQKSDNSKTQLVLWTIDCSQKLMIDLWISFDQLPRRRNQYIPAVRILNTLTEPACELIPALHQLPPDIDLCLLVQHLAKKRKTLSNATVQDRIARVCDRLKRWSPQAPNNLLAGLRNVADRLPRAILIASSSVEFTEEYLLQSLAETAGNRGLRILEPRSRRSWLTNVRRSVLRRWPTIAIIGSDGAGKSSTVAAFSGIVPAAKPIVAKTFYRRSLIYQLTSGLMKRLKGMERDRFDDHAAILITLRATIASWIRICLPVRPHTTIMDRSIAGFLITSRKSDAPQLARGAKWIEPWIRPTTSVLLTMTHSELSCRKHEMSAPGHTIYQRMLFDQVLRQKPVDLVLLASGDSASDTAEGSAIALMKILRTGVAPNDASAILPRGGKAAA